ncbi:MAG: FAD-dependent oxidoreductase, partial [Kiritimatiellia bacterium]|nr:FAD-dependent oxidoreductase [Kiritimatiellia bacterium]
MKSWICVVCGYVHSGDAPPDVCPVCGAGAEDFEEQKVAAPKPVTRVWTCLTCGYTHEGDAPPESCPVCGVPAERFEAVAPGTPAVRSGRPVHVLIVGAGIAGVSAAEAIVQSDSAARVTLLHDESALPYYRLSLTRYLAGEIGGDALPIHPAAWYVENRIERLGGVKVTRLIPEDRAVELADGRRLTGDAVIWATGAHAFIPPLPGADLAGVFPLRTIADADAILSRAASRPACAV